MLLCRNCGFRFDENDEMYNKEMEECPKRGGIVYTPCEEDWRDYINE